MDTKINHIIPICFSVKMAELITFQQERRSPFFPCKFSSIKFFNKINDTRLFITRSSSYLKICLECV